MRVVKIIIGLMTLGMLLICLILIAILVVWIVHNANSVPYHPPSTTQGATGAG